MASTNEASSETSDSLVAKLSGAKSAVWAHFGFEADAEGKPKVQDAAICRLCKKTVSAKGGNTSNLLSHLKVHHPLKHMEVIQAKRTSSKPSGKDSESSTTASTGQTQASLLTVLTPAQKYDRKSRKWQKLTDSVTHCLAKDMMPIYSVEKEGFRQLLHSFDPQYELPGRKYFSNNAIPKLYTKTRETVAAEVQSAEFLAATTDMWSSFTAEPYMSYTVHFVADDWTLKTRCLQTLYLPQDHTGENIAEALKETLESWEIDVAKQVCLTTDNGSNIVHAANRCLRWTRLSCFGHNLHLAVGNAIKDDTRVSRALGVCRKLVATFSHSWKKKREMSKVQQELGLPQHSLVPDCATRWGSSQKMVSRVLEQEMAIRKVLSGNRKTSHLIPTWQDVDVLESIQAALGQLSDFTDMLSAENFVTMSSILPVLHILQHEVLVEAESDTQLTKDIKARILTYLENKYSHPDVSELLNVTCFLDPHFTTEYITTSLEVAAVKDRLAREGVQMSTDSEPATMPITTHSSVEQEQSDGEPPHKRRKLGSWLKASKQQRDSTDSAARSPEASIKEEIERYSKIAKPDPEKTNPLDWWKLQASSYPVLAKLAKKYLCICASSSASERLFSTSGHICSKNTLLKPEKLNMLVFLAKNL